MNWSEHIERRLKLHDLHVLITVVQAGSMSKAASLLHTGQSAISRSIAELERTLGVRLLERNPRGVEPTAYGRALLKGGAAVFDDLRQAAKNIEFLADPTVGEVRIGSTPLLAASFVSALVSRLSQRYPRMIFHVVTGYVETLHRELSEHKLELLIVRKFGPIADDRLHFETLFNDASIVTAGSESPWARRRSIDLAELASESWVLPPPGSQIAAVAKEAFRVRGLGYPRTTVITDSPEVRMSLMATGRFLSIFSASALKFSSKRQEIKALPIELPMAAVENGVVTLKNRSLTPVAQLFINCARDVAKRKRRPK